MLQTELELWHLLSTLGGFLLIFLGVCYKIWQRRFMTDRTSLEFYLRPELCRYRIKPAKEPNPEITKTLAHLCKTVENVQDRESEYKIFIKEQFQKIDGRFDRLHEKINKFIQDNDSAHREITKEFRDHVSTMDKEIGKMRGEINSIISLGVKACKD